uniref:WD repeat and SOCS box containing 2 n=1 Tax=Otus sunia TaxID=257818 RepID=A0A8C8AG24_9STRI
MLCSAAGEKSALLWSMRSYTLIRRLEGHQSSVVSCDFSPDSALLVTASYDACVIMWDPYTGEQLRTLRHVPLHSVVDYSSEVHTSSLRSVCFSPEGLYLATVADDRLLRIWALELRSPVAFAPMTNGLCCMYFPHGGFIATGCVVGRRRWRNVGLLPPPAALGLLSKFQASLGGCNLVSWAGERMVAASFGFWGGTGAFWSLSALCSWLVWVPLQHQRWPRPILDRSKGPLVAKALVSQSSAHLPDDVPGPRAPHSQEAEGIPHLPDILRQRRKRGHRAS